MSPFRPYTSWELTGGTTSCILCTALHLYYFFKTDIPFYFLMTHFLSCVFHVPFNFLSSCWTCGTVGGCTCSRERRFGSDLCRFPDLFPLFPVYSSLSHRAKTKGNKYSFSVAVKTKHVTRWRSSFYITVNIGSDMRQSANICETVCAKLNILQTCNKPLHNTLPNESHIELLLFRMIFPFLAGFCRCEGKFLI